MKKLSRIILSLVVLLAITIPSFAESDKIITLKDGSNLIGHILSLQDDVYTIKTQNLGQIQIKQEDILSISQPQTLPSPSPNVTPASSMNYQPKDIQGQVQRLQGNVMNDPKMMAEIQRLSEDKEIMSILSDPEFMKDVMSYDPERLQNNPKLKALMDNPGMKALMERMGQMLGPAPQK